MKVARSLRRLDWVSLLLTTAIACLPLAGCKSKPPPPPQPSTAAVEKSLREQAVEKFLKEMNVWGKPALIEFGTVGCALSEKGLEGMMAIQRDGTVPGLAMIRVEGSQNATVVDAYFKAKAVSFPVYRDEKTSLAQALSATAYPTFMLVDKFGHVRYVGSYPQENLVQWGKSLVAETTDPGAETAMFGAKAADVQKLLACKLPDLKGQVRSFKEYLGDNGVMLLFVDTSCPFSAVASKEMPIVSQALARQKINCVVVNNDDPKVTVESFYADKTLGAPLVYDAGATTRELFNVRSVPIVVYISPAGAIGYQGEAVWARMGAAIEKSLGLAAGTIRVTAEGTGYG